jgi:hypothetical protein
MLPARTATGSERSCFIWPPSRPITSSPLLIERLHTTHYKKKLRMCGAALSNSGLIEFKAADKEHFVRVLRDLSLNELQVLDDQRLSGWFPHVPGKEIQYANEVLEKLFRLQAMGLVLSRIEPAQPPAGTTGRRKGGSQKNF